LADPDIRRWAHRFGMLEFRRKNRPLMRAEVVRDGSHERLPLIAALKADVLTADTTARRVLIVGEPGSGKTTGLERLTWELAVQQRGLSVKSSKIPILIRLNYFDGSGLDDFIKQTVEDSTKNRSGKVLAGHFRELVAKGHLVFLLDALDEALASKRGD